MKKLAVVLAVIALIAAVALLQWRHTNAPTSPLQDMATRMSQGLPKPYVDGLVTESVRAVGDNLVIDIRIPDIRLESLDPQKVPIIRQQEQAELMGFACNDPELRPLLDEGKTKIGRRFVDQDRRLIFEVVVGAKDCPLGRQL
ncbi:hypothetical protein [Arenimonas sp.]|uniref:hypothetical protein n=1 Tax=Arenimonas sp. TaxID=1872635 RepID=UPI0039E4E3A5